MSRPATNEREKSIQDYNRTFVAIEAILVRASLEHKNKGLSHEELSKIYDQIKATGTLAPMVISNVIEFGQYREFFLVSYEFLKPYFEETLASTLWGTKKTIIELLPNFGEQSYDLLYRVFSNDGDNDRRFEAAVGLLKIGDIGSTSIVNAIDGKDSRNQAIAIDAVGKVATYELKPPGNTFGIPKTNQEVLVGILQKNLLHENDNVRTACFFALDDIGRLDKKVLLEAIEDRIPQIRHRAVFALAERGLDSTSAPVFVRALEDAEKTISDSAFSRITPAFIRDTDAFAVAIIQELIVRSSGRPKEFFNTQLTADSIKKVCDLNPRLSGIVLHQLRDLAFQFPNDPIMPRCTFVAQKLNKKEFVALVGERTKENPAVVNKILRVIDSGLSVTGLPSIGISDNYVNLERLNELNSIKSDAFDLTKLIQLCEELNSSFENENYLSVAMLVRAILDHVPPILGFKTFVEVSSQYGGKSLKKSLQNLQNSSRNIADAHLHEPIRRKESLPNKTQVDFRNDLDVLLGEIVRVLK